MLTLRLPSAEVPVGFRSIGYALPFVSITAAVIAVHQLETLGLRTPREAILLSAIIVSAWFGGAGPGILAFVLSVATLPWLIPAQTARHLGLADVPYLIIFIGFATVIQISIHHHRRANQRVLESQDRLEALVTDRTTELLRTNSDLKVFQSVVRYSPDAIGVANLSFNLLITNPAGLQLFGLKDEEEAKRTSALDYVAESDREKVHNEFIPQLLAQGYLTVEISSRNLTTGRTFPALWTCFVIREPQTERPLLLASVIRDLSSRKLSEDELRRRAAYLTEAQEISHTGSWSWNVETEQGAWSDELFRIVGLRPGAVVPSPSTYEQYVHPGDLSSLAEVWSRALAQKQEFDHEHRIVRADGSIRYVRRRGRLFCNANHQLEFIGTVMDLTDQWKVRADLEAALANNTALVAELRTLQEQAKQENLSLKEQNLLLKKEMNRAPMFKEIIGASPALERVLARVARVAPTDSTVLITGETGTGKELIAHSIHRASTRCDRPLISINCGSILPSLIGSELFGHERGAFTGADQRRIGKFELAEGGTIFLDEVGEIPIETQVMLLRVLQEREFERVGGNTRIRTDVRVLAATNRNLELAIREGKFRSDLFYRLSVVPIEVPPLRERKEDISTLVAYFVQQYCRKLGREIRQIDSKAIELLRAYDWPGNIRELQNLIERSIIISDGDVLEIDERLLCGKGTSSFDRYTVEMENYERKLIEDALERSHGKVAGPTGAAAKLGLPQSTLATRIAVLRIDKHRFAPR